MSQTTQNSRIIKASAEKIFKAITDPKALETWQAPFGMTTKVHALNLKEGRSSTMSLFYPPMEI
ncbi:SRPBCC domain-containing protein [Olivibacter sp. SDN3]|uniref:SRPBCC domain-containing protein n=1 Tax=Olivibacter sp. SDN3 TaxID=2764720 RepID=UPI00165101C8|nr:SRPBCC domain-containing protein [Olivibacter sp. SDN3]QNL51841.1 SRPBCC domain-containing protein [Olivibacter sp. SDN3]